MKIGFIGIGVMGESMARHLLEGGHALTVYNRTRQKAERLLAQGAAEAVAERGLLGALTGGLSSASAGIAASLTVAFVMALAGRSRDQN